MNQSVRLNPIAAAPMHFMRYLFLRQQNKQRGKRHVQRLVKFHAGRAMNSDGSRMHRSSILPFNANRRGVSRNLNKR